MKRIIPFVVLAVLAGCSRVETGEIGLRKTFNGTVEQEPLGTGFHQSMIGSVLIFSARETLVQIKGLQPVTSDKLPMQDLDVRFTYKVNPASTPALYTHYSPSYSVEEGGEIFVMRAFVEQLVRSAVSDAVAKYHSLEVNDKRTEITAAIQTDVTAKIKAENLDKDVSVGQIVFTNVSLPSTLVESTAAVVKAQNDAKAAEFTANVARVAAQGTADAAVIKAKGEALAVQAQAAAIQSQGGDAYLRLEAIRKWDGKMPIYMGPHQPLPFVGVTGKE